MSFDLYHIRTDFTRNEDPDIMKADPISQFRYWLQDAIDASTIDATAFSFSTATKDGVPSSRILLLKEVTDDGFYFFSNYESQKAKELEENPIASILFFWARTERQVRILGKVEKISSAKSDAYFHARPKESQISTIISPQSREIPNRKYLLDKQKKIKDSDKEISRPDFWGGYCLIPKQFEFWQGGAERLHHRYVYKRVGRNEWDITLIAP